MKKSLLALAVLGAFAGAASAQSSVTIGGFIDAGPGKNIGSTDKTLLDSGGSRLYFKGMEDLGGGLAANFNIEHRLNPQDGTSASTTFWNGRSTVGLSGAFGAVDLGRDYTVAFLMIQNQIDPFLGDTVADLRDTGMRVGKITTVRSASEVEYHFGANGFNFGADIAGSNENGRTSRPYSLAANYAAGPLFVGVGIEDAGAVAGGVNQKIWDLGARYNFGPATLAAGMSKGTTSADKDAKGYLLGLTVPAGSGDFKVGYARSTVGGSTTGSKVGIGYHYYLSKRTQIYVDAARDSKSGMYSQTSGAAVAGVTGAVEATGYNFGLRQSF